ncbi:MAG: DNA-processing protein DprA [candidate division KSB1 bacterium]|nr:DNA-processing protein DprA [candidate division KSB1 bacterium]
MNHNELSALLQLLSVPGIGPTRIRALVGHFRSAEAVLRAPVHALCQVEGIEHTLAENIHHADNVASAQQQLDLAERQQCRILSFWDSEFPAALKRTYDPPVVLFVKGELRPEDEFAIAIVGTRTPTEYGKIATERLTAELTGRGMTIVSGLARGIDTMAHQTALKSGGRTIAVLGSGLDIIYPPENRRLAQEVVQHGAVISEYFFGTKPDAVNFPRRNRIISGLAFGTLVIEAGEESGALITAQAALEQGREVFAVPGSIFSPKSLGPHRLIQEGAKLTMRVEDILAELPQQLDLFSKSQTSEAPVIQLNENEQKVMALLSHEPIHIDPLARQVNMPASQLLSILLELEFKNAIRQLPGKFFVKTS